jgi:hypothetical protein
MLNECYAASVYPIQSCIRCASTQMCCFYPSKIGLILSCLATIVLFMIPLFSMVSHRREAMIINNCVELS